MAGIGSTEHPLNILNFIWHIENQDYATGTFCLDAPLSAGENLVIATGLDEIHGIFVADEDYEGWIYNITPEYTAWSFTMMDEDSSQGAVGITPRGTNGTIDAVYSTTLGNMFARSTTRIDGGNVYCTPNYGGNANYTPFCAGHTYRWIAW